jgi:hypothetical protein
VLEYLRTISSDVTLVQGDFDEFTSQEYTVRLSETPWQGWFAWYTIAYMPTLCFYRSFIVVTSR